MQNDAAELKLSAERKAGVILTETDKNPGGQREQKSYAGHDVRGRPPTLEELHISEKQSQRWQLEASVSEERYERNAVGLLSGNTLFPSSRQLVGDHGFNYRHPLSAPLA